MTRFLALAIAAMLVRAEFIPALTGESAQSPGARAMFYANAWPSDPGADLLGQATAGLRPMAPAATFDPQGPVGIHYWFEDAHGTRLSGGQAGTRGSFSLHVRASTPGFLTAWLLAGEDGTQLTPYGGVPVGQTAYRLPGELAFESGALARKMILIYARSQTEQSSTVSHARARLQTIGAWTTADGPQVMREIVENVPDEVGTYVVNRVGMPVGVEILLSRP